jgi:dihydroorotase
MNPLKADDTGRLVVKNGTVMDPARDIHARLDVDIRNGRIHALKEPTDVPNEANAYSTIDASGKLVVPELIDLHTHVYWGGSSICIQAEDHLLRSGVTTWVDAGSAGAGNFRGFKHHVVDPSLVRILAFLNISFAGIAGGPQPGRSFGCRPRCRQLFFCSG